MVNCFHSGVETFRRTLADKVRKLQRCSAVDDGGSFAITKVNASKYNGIHNQMQTLYYSNGFQILEHPLHYHYEKNTSIVLMLHACVPSINVNMVLSNHDGL